MKALFLHVNNEQQSRELAAIFAHYCFSGILYLVGELGSGKTTFTQAFIRSLGYSGTVKSPTYTLLEPYELEKRNIYHFDLYRLEDEEELLFLGCDEYFEHAQQEIAGEKKLSKEMAPSICLIEWPGKAASVLPAADIEIKIEYDKSPDRTEARLIDLQAKSRKGVQMLNAMQVELQSFVNYV